MTKVFSEFVCQQCGYKSPQFLGRCPECGEWNSLVESIDSTRNDKLGRFLSGKQISTNFQLEDKVFKLTDVRSQKFARTSTTSAEFDRVLGGGIVPGSIVLISGDPGIGKSTLLLQVAMRLAQNSKASKVTKESFDKSQDESKESKVKKTFDSSDSSVTSVTSVLYVSGEESASQVRLRAERVGKIPGNLYILPETDVDLVVAAADQLKPALLIIDSVQTLQTERLTSSAGSVGQLRECAQILQRFAKSNLVPVFIVGHVTKEGSIAGPKVLEHLVDTVLNLEGDDMHAFRLLRSSKNRFGSTYEVGVFEMQDAGMVEVNNPSQIFLEERISGRAGSVVCATLAGGRPLLCEVQALCTSTVFPVPTRRVTGLDFSRIQIVIAALSKVSKLNFANMDVFVSVAGGLKVVEPAADLAAALAVVSAALDKPIKKGICAFGEVGLLGELRSVSNSKVRSVEAKRLGFEDIVTSERFKTLEEAIDYAVHE